MTDPTLAPDLITRVLDASSRVMTVFVSPDHWLYAVIAALPALGWLYVVGRFQHENKWLLASTFFMGIVCVIPIFVLQYEIADVGNWLSVIFATGVVGIFFQSFWVGTYEETAKNWAMRLADSDFLRDIDDAIILGMVAGLGFAFIENVMYFYQIANNPSVGSQWGVYAAMRILLSNTLHVVASGIFGYFYGVAHFATEEYQQELREGKKFFFTQAVHRVLHMKGETLFHEEKMMEGLLCAAGIHGVFDGLMGVSSYLTEKGSSLGPICLMLTVPLLGGSLWWLVTLLNEKENRKDLGHLGAERTSVVTAG